MDVDVGKIPEPHRLSPTSDPDSIPTLDGWIENLMNCKQLAENDVQRLCDRVRTLDGIQDLGFNANIAAKRLEKCFRRSRMSNRWYVLAPMCSLEPMC